MNSYELLWGHYLLRNSVIFQIQSHYMCLLQNKPCFYLRYDMKARSWWMIQPKWCTVYRMTKMQTNRIVCSLWNRPEVQCMGIQPRDKLWHWKHLNHCNGNNYCGKENILWTLVLSMPLVAVIYSVWKHSFCQIAPHVPQAYLAVQLCTKEISCAYGFD